MKRRIRTWVAAVAAASIITAPLRANPEDESEPFRRATILVVRALPARAMGPAEGSEVPPAEVIRTAPGPAVSGEEMRPAEELFRSEEDRIESAPALKGNEAASAADSPARPERRGLLARLLNNKRADSEVEAAERSEPPTVSRAETMKQDGPPAAIEAPVEEGVFELTAEGWVTVEPEEETPRIDLIPRPRAAEIESPAAEASPAIAEPLDEGAESRAALPVPVPVAQAPVYEVAGQRITSDLYNPNQPVYQIRTGDTLQISVPGEADTIREVPVRPDGRINYLFDIELMAAGLTYQQLNRALCSAEYLGKYYRNPQVTIIGKNFGGNSVYVMGPVLNPGRHTIQNDTRLLDVLSMAGAGSLIPQTESAANDYRDVIDFDRALLVRNETPLPVNFKGLLSGRELAQNNIVMQPRDFIYLPSSYSSDQRIYVIGQVSDPKVMHYSGSTSFLEAVADAGGLLDGQAWSRRCFVIRGGLSKPREVLRVSYQAIIDGKTPDLALESGDVVFIPKNPLSKTTEVLRSVLNPLQAILELDDINKNRFHEGDRQYKDIFKQRFWH